MNNEVEYADFSFDDEAEVVEFGGGFTLWGRLRFYSLKAFPKGGGASLTVPGVYDDVYDEATKTSTRAGLRELKGLEAGGKKQTLYLLVLEQKNVQGQWWQSWPLRFGNWSYRDAEEHPFFDKQKPALAAIPDVVQRLKLQNTGRLAMTDDANLSSWVYAKVTRSPSGISYVDRNDVKRDEYYYSEIVTYADEATWQVAKDAYFAEINGASAEAAPLDFSHFPAVYTNAEEAADLYNYLMTKTASLETEGPLRTKVLKAAGLLQADGVLPGLTAEGKEVDIERILEEAVHWDGAEVKPF